jgi:hypothetical protein
MIPAALFFFFAIQKAAAALLASGPPRRLRRVAMTADRRTHGFRKVSSKLNAGPEGQANAQPEALAEGKHWRQ